MTEETAIFIMMVTMFINVVVNLICLDDRKRNDKNVRRAKTMGWIQLGCTLVLGYFSGITWYCLLPTMGCGYAAYHILSFAYWQEHVDALNAALDEVVIRFDEAKKADDMERAKTLQEEHKRLLDLLKKAIGWKERA